MLGSHLDLRMTAADLATVCILCMFLAIAEYA